MSTLDLWLLRLDLTAETVAALRALLAPDEIERAERFRFENDRRRYIAARGQLRRVLGRLTAQPAQAIRFEYGEYGKPRLAGGAALEFNLAHSGELGVLGVARGVPVGVDIEQVREMPDQDEIARRFFAPGEVARWSALPPAVRPAAFFRCWTRKEALLKAHGAGLSLGLDTFEVSFEPGDAPRLLWSAAGSPEAWLLYDVEAAPGYIAAAAIGSAGEPVTARWNGAWPAGDGL